MLRDFHRRVSIQRTNFSLIKFINRNMSNNSKRNIILALHKDMKKEKKEKEKVECPLLVLNSSHISVDSHAGLPLSFYFSRFDIAIPNIARRSCQDYVVRFIIEYDKRNFFFLLFLQSLLFKRILFHILFHRDKYETSNYDILYVQFTR